jgi:hypothetical protein
MESRTFVSCAVQHAWSLHEPRTPVKCSGISLIVSLSKRASIRAESQCPVCEGERSVPASDAIIASPIRGPTRLGIRTLSCPPNNGNTIGQPRVACAAYRCCVGCTYNGTHCCPDRRRALFVLPFGSGRGDPALLTGAYHKPSRSSL